MKPTSALLLLGSISVVLAQTNTTTAWPPYSPTNAPMFQMSSDEEFAFYLSEAMSLADGGAANTGEVLRIATSLVPHDFESVYTSFNYMATHIHAMADNISSTGLDPVGARQAYFRAATYYRGADFFNRVNLSDPRIYTVWDKALTCFDKANALLPIPGERFSVKAHSEEIGDYEAIGIFYKAKDCNESTPTILVGSGYDGSQEETYHGTCIQVLARGINCVTYEGPGQPTVRRQQQIGFIRDWWTAASPVMDYLATRPDVDMKKVALFGLSFGGTLAPIAASHDDRYSAVVMLDGLASMRRAIEDSLPKELTAVYNATNVTAWNAVMTSIPPNSTYPSSLRWLIGQSLFAFKTTLPYDWFTRLGYITINSTTVSDIKVPVFIGKGQDDTLTLNEPDITHGMFVNGRPHGKELTTFHEFRTDLGAGEHCAIGGEAQENAVVLEWLSGVWGNHTLANQFSM